MRQILLHLLFFKLYIIVLCIIAPCININTLERSVKLSSSSRNLSYILTKLTIASCVYVTRVRACARASQLIRVRAWIRAYPAYERGPRNILPCAMSRAIYVRLCRCARGSPTYYVYRQSGKKRSEVMVWASTDISKGIRQCIVPLFVTIVLLVIELIFFFKDVMQNVIARVGEKNII